MAAKNFTIFIFLSFLFLQTSAQLSGSYTIGGTNPDYATINDAANALIAAGASGPVTFNIRPGTYNERINLGAYSPAASQLYPITFQSELQDSSTVIINNPTAGYTTFALGNGYYIINSLTILNASYTSIYSGRTCEIYYCHIHGSPKAIDGKKLIVQFNTIEGSVYGAGYSDYSDNVITGNVNHYGGGCEFNSNLISGDVYTNHNCIFKGNFVLGNVRHSRDTINSSNNNITGELKISYGSATQVYDNNVSSLIDFTFSPHALCYNNSTAALRASYSDSMIFFGNKTNTMNSLYSTGISFYNNFILESINCSYSSNFSYKFNNVSISSHSYVQLAFCSNVELKNNILPASLSMPYGGINLVSGNDYPAGGGFYDSAPVFIDPGYRDSTDLHATNPQLNEMAPHDSIVIRDIDNVFRQFYPALSANEICFHSSDTMTLYCGDSAGIMLCNYSLYNSPLWSPSTGLDNVYSNFPKVLASVSQWYVVSDSVSGMRDSLFVNVIPFVIKGWKDDSTNICGRPFNLYATYNSNAIYSWSPIDSLSDPANYATIANPSHSVDYVVTANVPGCGSSSDTIHLVVDSLPFAYAYLDSASYNYFEFHNASNCWFNCHWDFGDSTQSTLTNPVHVFSDTGNYLITLIVCNNFGCDTFAAYVNVDSMNTNLYIYDQTISPIHIFPNPAKDHIEISFNRIIKSGSLHLYNSFGELVSIFLINNESDKFIYLGKLPAGIYFLVSDDPLYSGKIVIE